MTTVKKLSYFLVLPLKWRAAVGRRAASQRRYISAESYHLGVFGRTPPQASQDSTFEEAENSAPLVQTSIPFFLEWSSGWWGIKSKGDTQRNIPVTDKTKHNLYPPKKAPEFWKLTNWFCWLQGKKKKSPRCPRSKGSKHQKNTKIEETKQSKSECLKVRGRLCR